MKSVTGVPLIVMRRAGELLTNKRLIVVALVFGVFALWRISAPHSAKPQDRIAVSSGWADEQRCVECHQQAVDFGRTGHARTLRLAVDVDSVVHLRRLSEDAPQLDEALRLHFSDDHVHAVDSGHGVDRQLPLDWCFGSGRHACTWVGTLSDSWGTTDLVEFRWTWYSALERFDVTPGQPPTRGDDHFGGLGVLFDHPKARRCFACHASFLPMHEGRLDESKIKAGVTCQRCHGPQQKHVKSGGAFVPESLHRLSQSESVRRCAQCHRSADEQSSADITRENREIVRFQPVGLVQSACFQKSSTLTCVTCHDPHRPLEAQDSGGIWQCVQCHDSTKPDRTACQAGHRENCLKCHMPKVRGAAPLFFTDHWIRVRHDEASP